MKLKKFILKSFQDPNLKDAAVEAPMGSVFRKAMIFHDGIYAYYEVPDLAIEGGSTMVDKFKLLGPNDSIPNDGVFVDVLDMIIELPLNQGEKIPQQGIQTIPIYKLN